MSITYTVIEDQMARLFHGVPECAVDLADARGCLDGFATTEQAIAALAEIIAPYSGPEPADYELAERAIDALKDARA